MGEKKEILIISNINDIRIKKVQPWGIHFDYAGKHYFLHRYNDWDNALKLYEKTYVIDEKHKKGDYYELNKPRAQSPSSKRSEGRGLARQIKRKEGKYEKNK